MEKFAVGVCTGMCPQNEIDLRIREKLVHYFEKTENIPDRKKFTTNFTRSAAGTTYSDLRTPQSLDNCVKYLLTK